MNKRVFELDFCGKNLKVETGELAKQAGGSVLVRYEDTVVLSAATASKKAKDIDFFPLTVTYEEKLYSVGKIPGGFLRREGRPSEHATLTSRLIDRTIRPLFAEGFRNEVQVVNTVLSVDQDSAPDMAAMFGASLSLMVSDIPFEGPIAGVTVGYIDETFVINPTLEEQAKSKMHLIVAGTKDAINMVEAGAEEVSEELMLEAMLFGHEWIKRLCAFQIEIAQEVAKEKMEVTLYEVPSEIVEEVEALVGKDLREAVAIHEKLKRYGMIDELEEKAVLHFEAKSYETESEKHKTVKYVKEVTHGMVADEVRRLISIEKIRPDGRGVDEVRPLNVQIDLLSRVHGSGLFTRGETQVLSVCTLGAMADTQIIDDLSDVDSKRFLHHYNFPPYSVGETGRMGAPGRREIGHGALGERALSYVIPSEEEFPYTIRLVAEVLESNGSSSQASICAGSLALMAAGVPVKAAVSGIAMGLVQYGDDYTILTDIQGMEDHFGDMDFKVAGTKKGITALQMDIKIKGLSEDILREALAQAKTGRAEMMAAMDEVISEPRNFVGEYAPKIAQMNIKPDKIRDVIGAGGKIINQIIEDCNDVKIDIEDDGRVVIYHTDQASIDKAKAMIENIVRVAAVGEIYDAKVVRIEKFGAFVNLFQGTDALLHVSKMDHNRVEKPEDIVKLGDIVKVKVMEIDEKGRVNVSRKALLPKPEVKKEDEKSAE
ncbi:polyribonucleotide nucleotidyltransferase [Erysipelothrix rhusiopathiae]|uniref:polyribonucleotide nucleotidyltransferase n=1 Tax=Erysipelothrix rhusiopathiae TaxID=1648 RepID=UPI000210B789|nr:polyribonucleotide nucleotidyltransferase [Erysipelothrix rhusiopathiae]AGN23723.1 polynucleotide phosphorylase/polyadenylase [Erysipelothrix rhusiopathiae SY1027]AMS11502.1 polyribonucleotide nucleotidyltransferase [Erysipelothrix rhusiopathiae]AOO68001.1 polyribonucleotide nucleotidyltransferase [Erysipelothrix rhusiopathiae]MCG4437118.1 polyribonucleotide nucleotidyltransferase [Erysipelothrix rhusiopathiae]MDE8032949.1 polyribonucleotide nucleotidyltransferase [Erysipelothrix rhusiopath